MNLKLFRVINVNAAHFGNKQCYSARLVVQIFILALIIFFLSSSGYAVIFIGKTVDKLTIEGEGILPKSPETEVFLLNISEEVIGNYATWHSGKVEIIDMGGTEIDNETGRAGLYPPVELKSIKIYQIPHVYYNDIYFARLLDATYEHTFYSRKISSSRDEEIKGNIVSFNNLNIVIDEEFAHFVFVLETDAALDNNDRFRLKLYDIYITNSDPEVLDPYPNLQTTILR